MGAHSASEAAAPSGATVDASSSSGRNGSNDETASEQVSVPWAGSAGLSGTSSQPASTETRERGQQAAPKAVAAVGKAPAWYAKFAEVTGKAPTSSSASGPGPLAEGG